MNPGRFFVPNMYRYPIIRTGFNSLITGGNNGFIPKILNSIKKFNWQKLLTNTNRTLNVVNQTIPLINQAKPMVNNVKSIIKLAKAFGNETNHKIAKVNSTQNKIPTKNITNTNLNNNDYPTFFV